MLFNSNNQKHKQSHNLLIIDLNSSLSCFQILTNARLCVYKTTTIIVPSNFIVVLFFVVACLLSSIEKQQQQKQKTYITLDRTTTKNVLVSINSKKRDWKTQQKKNMKYDCCFRSYNIHKYLVF